MRIPVGVRDAFPLPLCVPSLRPIANACATVNLNLILQLIMIQMKRIPSRPPRRRDMSFDNSEIEQRLAHLEAALHEVQEKLGIPAPSSDWVERVSGSLADIPEDDYQQFLECCRSIRNGDPVSGAEVTPP